MVEVKRGLSWAWWMLDVELGVMSNDSRSVTTVEWEEGSHGLAARASLGDVDADVTVCDCDREGKVM